MKRSLLAMVDPEAATPDPPRSRSEQLTRWWTLARPLLIRWGVPLAALIVCLVITGRAHWHHIRPYATPVSNDEGYISAVALRMIEGHWLPYVDGVSQRGPVLYWLAAAVLRVGGMYSWTTLRWLAMILGFSLTGLTFFAAARLFAPFAGAVAAVVVTYFLTYELNPWDGIGYNGEIVAMVFTLAATWVVAHTQQDERVVGRRRLAWLAAAGVLTALAGLSKQMSLIHAGPAVLWILLGPAWGEPSRRERLRDVGAWAAGFLVPYALVLTLYAATGHLKEFVYYYQRYGRDIFMAPLTREYMRDKLREQIDRYYLGAAGVAGLGLLALGRAVRAYLEDEGHGWARARRQAPGVFAFAQLVAAVAGASFTWRFFPHYFVQVFPFAAVVAGYAVGERFDSREDRPWPGLASGLVVVIGAGLVLAIAGSALHRNVRVRRELDRWYQEPQSDPIVRYVLEKTRPGDSIFVWGFRAETYVSARRRPASRFVYTVYPSGVVPWFQATRQEEERRVVPGSRELLLEDLEASRPELVIDAGRSMNGRYMYNYPMLRRYLDQNYCFMRYVDGEPVYRRRHGEHCPPADY